VSISLEARCTFFKHNDMKDLASILEGIAKNDKRLKRDAAQQRRFIVVEGLYRLTGDLCPLPELLQLKKKYCYRIMMDESMSFGTIGNAGRGLTEFYGVDIKDIDMITIAMDNTLGSIGGGCIGARDVIDHQRLSGAGYCFSASCPPFLFAGAIESLKHLRNNGQDLLITLRSNVQSFIKSVKSSIPQLQVVSSEESPIIQMVLSTKLANYDAEYAVTQEVANRALNRGLAIVATSYDIKLLAEMKETNTNLRATLCVNMTTELSSGDLKKIIKELKTSVVEVLGK